MTLPSNPWKVLLLNSATVYYVSRVCVSARPPLICSWPGLSHTDLLTGLGSTGEPAVDWMIRAGFSWTDSAIALALSWSRRLALACINDRDSGLSASRATQGPFRPRLNSYTQLALYIPNSKQVTAQGEPYYSTEVSHCKQGGVISLLQLQRCQINCFKEKKNRV